MQKLPESAQIFLGMIQSDLPNLLPDILIGIYVYGSISYDAFDEKRSDVDVAVFLSQPLNSDELQKLATWFKSTPMSSSKWITECEMDFFAVGDVSPRLKNTITTTRFTEGRLQAEVQFEGAVLDLENIRSCGITLYGKNPQDVIPEIDEALILEAVSQKFAELKEHVFEWIKIDLWNQVYVVVTLCRVLYALENHGKPISKKAAAEWGAKNAPEQFHPMIAIAAKKIDDLTGPMEEVITQGMPEFVEYIGGVLQARR